MAIRSHPARESTQPEDGLDPEEAVGLLLRDLRGSPDGLSTAEAERRLLQFGPNELHRRAGLRWPGELAAQLTHPLALLLWVAAGLSFAVGNGVIAVAILLVIVLNAGFALAQELQAERAVEALADYLPQQATVLRSGEPRTLDVAGLVPGDVIVLEEGERVPADVRLIEGALDVDISTLTGESATVLRSAELVDVDVPRLSARDLAFMGATCTEGEARAVVFATGMHTEPGRIAALSQRVDVERSPLERQVRRVAWLIAGVAVAMAIAFVPIAVFAAGLSVANAVVFAVGLLAGNVPEGLLPVITLALAVAVRTLAKRGAVVKRLSAVETLGSTDVICTDKTGTLTENRMRPVAAWTDGGLTDLSKPATGAGDDVALTALARAAVACNNARLADSGEHVGDPTEIALMLAGVALGAGTDADERQGARMALFHFDPRLKLMSTVDRVGAEVWLHVKGAPEAMLVRCERILGPAGETTGLTAAAVARRVGIGHGQDPRAVMADAIEAMPECELKQLLAGNDELVFARATPEAKLRIAETLRELGHVVAMTGDGVNDAPALRRADIGVAMGRSGTDVAREAATMVLSDDNFTAVEAGRRVYDNVRKFIVYIFAHATPEVVPFPVFAFGGGLITRRASLRSVGVFSNRYLLAAVGGVIVFATVFVYVPPLQGLLDTAALPVQDVLFLLPYPFIVWGADELRRWLMRRRDRAGGANHESRLMHHDPVSP